MGGKAHRYVRTVVIQARWKESLDCRLGSNQICAGGMCYPDTPPRHHTISHASKAFKTSS